MDTQELRTLQEAYLGVYYDLDEERAEGVKPYEPRNRNPLPKEKPLSGERGDRSGYGPDEKFTKPDDKISKPGTTVPAPKKGGYGRISPSIPHGIGDHADKVQSRVSTITNKDPGAPKSQKLPPYKKPKPSREIIRKNKDLKDSYDLYDIILLHLLDEGYAETPEAAEVIMVNMSEDWRESIMEGLGGAKDQGDYWKREEERNERTDDELKKIKKRQNQRQKEQQAQEFLKKHPKK